MPRALLIALLCLAPSMLRAHHSNALNFTDDVMSVEGTIRSLRWVNPHATFVLEVASDDGATEEWRVEMLAKIALERLEFDFDALQEGARIRLTGRIGYRENTLNFSEAVLADGRIVRQRRPREIFAR